MPELPEVESLRRNITPHILNLHIASLTLHRPDIITGPATPADLLERSTITSLNRQGKQLSISTNTGRTLCIQLGMSGQLLFLPPGAAPTNETHIHIRWSLTSAPTAARQIPRGTLLFRDPRRFGGITTFPTHAALIHHWSTLGPDALGTSNLPLAHDLPALARLWSTTRPIKAALLDQRAIAGIGNIYADESLHRARINPFTPARALTTRQRTALLRAIHEVLTTAINSGGSTLRDYTDSRGNPGSFQLQHLVYARSGHPCTRCNTTLTHTTLAQRTTTWCPHCQPE